MDYKLSKAEIEKFVVLASGELLEYCQKNNIHFVVTGSSGGLDSAVTLGLADKACKMAGVAGYDLVSVGLIMPCHSHPDAERLGRMAIEKFNAEEIRFDLTDIFDKAEAGIIKDVNKQIEALLKKKEDRYGIENWSYSCKIAQGNIKARLRMMLGTYHVARMLNGMVLSTDNLSEFWMAFWTLHGDVGDFGMIQNVLKGIELYDIALFLGVPQEIIAAKPDDGLGIGNGDEDQLGANYGIVDRVMIELIKHGFDPDGGFKQLDNLPEIKSVSSGVVFKLAERCLKGSFKRKGALTLSRKQLGLRSIESLDVF